jgi:predicted nuclease with TOPRIM domain
MDQTSETILALKPVMFRYKNQDTRKAQSTPHFGLIAEDVAEVNPDLVVGDTEGEPLGVRYDAVNTMLLNEFLKEHRRVEELRAALSQQRKEFEAVVARLNEQEARIQKVSAQVEARKPGSQMLAETSKTRSSDPESRF